ncbi:flavin-dependent oxidoreductase [Streptomyces malaysiensis subsp. malaysiensis]|uniref:Flavin-dependent oxidoreductase n=1 Tax=Streptomyces malaysiensis TaxID=92644 RepID=A0ABX6VZT8_STRMQ|nr:MULTISPECIES: flavin-dependent oxidoreductase [Streptomyces]QPI54226.1 flavin-dependent oxidoreductase [Streptomyces solisilvae]UHH15620.1 flavin-dependent oxidoreductase [Streptomyces sp. HNM0561]
MTVLIAGAGIGGLTAALSLHAAGVEAAVVESAREIRPLGVGINLLPHAVRELIELGLGDELAAIGVATAENAYCDRSGRRIFTEPRGVAQGYRWPQYSVHRGELQRLLLAAVRERLGADAVRTGARVVGFDGSGARDRVRVRVLDRATGAVEDMYARALIGADGLHSAVRAALHPRGGPLLWSGIRMWRGATRAEPFLTGRSMVIVRDGDAELVAYPIGGGRINWVCQVRMSEPGPLTGEAAWNRAGRLADVLPYFADWRLGWLDVPGLLTGSGEILEYPMVDREPLPRWGSGRVTLLGDAAHPMYPVGANGASQAVVDARVLARELAREEGVPAALARYETERREATAAVVRANRAMHRAGARTPEELARLTDTYRDTTGGDVRTLNARASLSCR